ncbi:histidine phosphatase family protein [Salibacteraceae bacterium]|nr:histidine phosphatase family protein [Salibacteraceae bacterium]
MKTLYLVRHAKSSWDNASTRDIDRPLNESGIQAAYSVGNELLLHHEKPEWIGSSNAKRAMHTSVIFSRVLGVNEEDFHLIPSLYLCSKEEVHAQVSRLDSKLTSAALFFHNPSITEVANALGAKSLMNVKTCGVLKLKLPNWNIGPGSEVESIQYFDRSTWHSF